ncbi:hypothetical protein SAMN04490248_103207 [Salinihabitans flavidus]|uniref:Uncharacterized protein n=1 Tax=Salinihabitans flavidus TaxID=569882 RepID=A0A1H8NJ60_9RHOB|nr:hypothetical protein [Salinihabitans flavidus]SEO29602.1 hypothetical protein SAMN04490248_103207 [Salinihabitans flavidus]
MRLLALVLLLPLCGCLGYSTYYKPGTPLREAETLETECEVSALRKAPVQIVRDVTPIYGKDKKGRTRIIGYDYDEYDVNAGLRARVTRQCMQRQGFERVSIPVCDSEALDARGYSVVRGTPPLDESICTMRTKQGRVLLRMGPG